MLTTLILIWEHSIHFHFRGFFTIAFIDMSQFSLHNCFTCLFIFQDIYCYFSNCQKMGLLFRVHLFITGKDNDTSLHPVILLNL